MVNDIAQFLLNIVFTLFGAALILRAWMYAVRLPPFNPVARCVYQITNWLAQPLRKLIPATDWIDWTSLAAVWLTALVYLLLTWLVNVGALIPSALLPTAAASALLIAVEWALKLTEWVTLIQAVLSWVNPLAPLMTILRTLTDPLLNPIRQILPRLSTDFSPLVVTVIAQVLIIALTHARWGLIGM